MSVYVNDGMVVHWWFGVDHWCEEYVTGDTVIESTMGTTADVTCQECREMIHS
jgi:hypothetical protein